MIKGEWKPFMGNVECKIVGNQEKVVVEYNGLTMAFIKRMKKEGMTEGEIEKWLVENIALAFSMINIDGAIREVDDK